MSHSYLNLTTWDWLIGACTFDDYDIPRGIDSDSIVTPSIASQSFVFKFNSLELEDVPF